MSLNSSPDGMQSAVRKLHSIETALLQILNNICQLSNFKVSSPLCCQMIILDLSAFDSLRHDIIIFKLEMISDGSGLKWINSYILNSSSSVKFCDFTTDPFFYFMASHEVLSKAHLYSPYI